eukprot:scaffold31018_cov63-Phaeocystis_antarctica.AAC.4
MSPARRETSTRTRCAPPAKCAARGMHRPRRCASRRGAAWQYYSSLLRRSVARHCRTCGTEAAACGGERSGRCSASRSCPGGTLVGVSSPNVRLYPKRGARPNTIPST